MRPVAILQHQLPENAAYLTTWLERHRVEYVIFNAGADEEFPTSIEPYAALAALAVMGGGMSANAHWHYESFAIPAGAVRVATSDACPNQTRAMGLHLAMQFHIEINETKMVNWVTDDDAKCTQAQQQYATVQDRVTMLNGIVYHMKKHQGTADRIYQKWLSHTDLAPMQ